jgi:hypothetical protein
MDIPTYGKKRSWLQSNDIPKHTWQVDGRDDSSVSSLERKQPFLSGDGHF